VPKLIQLPQPKPRFALAEAAATAEPKLCRLSSGRSRSDVPLRCYLTSVPLQPKSQRRIPNFTEALSGRDVSIPVIEDASALIVDLGAGSSQFPGPHLPRSAPPWVEPSRTDNVRPTAVRSQTRSVVSFRGLAEHFASLQADRQQTENACG